MSRLKNGIRKVFRGAKNVVKKVWKPALIVGATLLTGGLAAGGFAAFSGASGIGGFMGAVGSTMAAGAQAIAGSLGIGAGISGAAGSSTAAFGAAGLSGATLGTGALAQGLGLATMTAGQASLANTMLAKPGGILSSAMGAGGTAAAASTGGFLGTAMSALKGMAGSNVGQLAIAQGIMGGIQSYAAARETRRQEKRHDSEYVWGAQRRGGDGSNAIDDFQLPEMPTDGPGRPPTPTEWRASDPQYANVEDDEPENLAFRNPLIPRRRTVPGMGGSDSDLFMPVGNQNSILYG